MGKGIYGYCCGGLQCRLANYNFLIFNALDNAVAGICQYPPAKYTNTLRLSFYAVTFPSLLTLPYYRADYNPCGEIKNTAKKIRPFQSRIPV